MPSPRARIFPTFEYPGVKGCLRSCSWVPSSVPALIRVECVWTNTCCLEGYSISNLATSTLLSGKTSSRCPYFGIEDIVICHFYQVMPRERRYSKLIWADSSGERIQRSCSNTYHSIPVKEAAENISSQLKIPCPISANGHCSFAGA